MVTISVCSNCAVSEPSAVTAVQPSGQMRPTSYPPAVIIGSIVNVTPGSRIPSALRVVVVRDRRRGVELAPDAVTDEHPHDAEARGLRVILDRAADLVDPPARSHRGDPVPHALTRDAHESFGFGIALADEEGLAVVAVHAVEVDRHVAVDDVALEQPAVVGDAVADHLVHRGAQRLRDSPGS